MRYQSYSMHIIYYAWVLQNISERIEIFFPKEVIVFIVNFMRSTIFKQCRDVINLDYITTIPIQSNKSNLYYDTNYILLGLDLFPMGKIHTRDSNSISFNLNWSTNDLKQSMMRIDNLLQSHQMRKQLFREKCDLYTYHSCMNREIIKMMLCKEIKLIKIMNKSEKDISFTGVEDIVLIFNRSHHIEIVYSLKILFTPIDLQLPQTDTLVYGVCPEIKIIKYKKFKMIGAIGCTGATGCTGAIGSTGAIGCIGRPGLR